MTEQQTDDFAAWARAYSQRTNRSLAGARFMPPADADPESLTQARQWGIVLDAEGEPMSWEIPDARKLTGLEAMEHAHRHMPVLRELMRRIIADGVDFTGVRIAVCLILEPKTAVLLRELKAAGAVVGVFAEPADTDQRVADQLASEGVVVEADVTWTPEQTHQGALRLLDEIRPQIIIDDGASFARLAAAERPELMADLIGVAEETTSGVRAFQAMQSAGALDFPVIAVNDSILKTGFDNAHGTGESCVTTMQELLGSHAFDGARVAVVGYGPVGKGFALRVRALGARVKVCDVNPVAALQAVFDGFAARDIDEAVAHADMVVSATGVRHTITVEHMRRMRERAVLAVIGGIANEIALDHIPGFRAETGLARRELDVPGGPTLILLSEGDGVNYTAGGGNPIEIMDLSFAVQASAVAHLLTHRGALAPGLHRLDEATDRRIAAVALETRGYQASHAVADNGYDWTLTRFKEAR
ncbi:adenosylhomocysteinase [Bifidobacterium eulemuris]|nr:adenosylhomocysteinase [Bifidobacterium eulemuris]QOL31909.1 adenosylhomocysteinase [Bifidobacterium eulemuris]